MNNQAPINPFASKPKAPAWADLGQYQDWLPRIQRTPNLIALINGFNLRAYQYLYLCQQGLIVDQSGTLSLTPVSAGYLERYCKPRFEGGDMVTIIKLLPRLGRMADTHGHWTGVTDDQYHLSIYPEDFSALKRAGYSLPDWNDRPADGYPCSIPVIVSREIQASGWRIASIVKEQA